VARIVLVADDSPTIQKKALGILKGEGFEVETVSNGVAAIKRLGGAPSGCRSC
jgi:CheY-like chemotaxis protein